MKNRWQRSKIILGGWNAILYEQLKDEFTTGGANLRLTNNLFTAFQNLSFFFNLTIRFAAVMLSSSVGLGRIPKCPNTRPQSVQVIAALYPVSCLVFP